MKTNQRTLRIILIVCIVIFLVLIFLFALQKNKYSTYEEVEAKIVSVDSKYGSGSNSKSRIHHVTYQYEVEGELYTSKLQVFSRMGKREGDIVTVWYNPQNPNILKNTYAVRSLLFVIIFVGVFTTLLCIIVLKNKRY